MGQGSMVGKKVHSVCMTCMTLIGEVMVQTETINDAQLFYSCYLITRKVMENYIENECTLDAIAVGEFIKK
jgi:hypothetical protein